MTTGALPSASAAIACRHTASGTVSSTGKANVPSLIAVTVTSPTGRDWTYSPAATITSPFRIGASYALFGLTGPAHEGLGPPRPRPALLVMRWRWAVWPESLVGVPWVRRG